MTSLNQRECARLIGILARLGSDFDGERSAAGLLATRLLKTNGLVWDDLITRGDTQVPTIVVVRPSAPSWRGDLAVAMRHLSKLTAWEGNFVCGLAVLSKTSEKQKRVLAEIVAGLRSRGLE